MPDQKAVIMFRNTIKRKEILIGPVRLQKKQIATLHGRAASGKKLIVSKSFLSRTSPSCLSDMHLVFLQRQCSCLLNLLRTRVAGIEAFSDLDAHGHIYLDLQTTYKNT